MVKRMWCAFKIWLTILYEERKRNKHKDAERIIVTAAKLIMAEIRGIEYDTSVDPKNVDIKTPSGTWLPKTFENFAVALPPGTFSQYIADNVDYNL